MTGRVELYVPTRSWPCDCEHKSKHELQFQPLKQGFATQLTLDNIHRTFTFLESKLALEESTHTFLQLFRNTQKSKEKDLGYFSSLTEKYYSFGALSFLWEKVIAWNLEGGHEWLASEQSLLEQAKYAPSFILQLVSLRTTNIRVKSFLSKIQ